MPFIYEFGCFECEKKVELTLPMDERNSQQVCPVCHTNMNRLVEIPRLAVFVETGREQVLANLNARDDGIGNKPRIKNAMWKGLNQKEPVVGRGF